MSPKSAQRFWDNDMHRQQPKAGKAKRFAVMRLLRRFQEKLRFPLFSFAPQPFVGCVAHRLFRAIPKPGHERSIEFERIAALLDEKAPHVLGVAIGLCDGGGARNRSRMPVERFHRQILATATSDATTGLTTVMPVRKHPTRHPTGALDPDVPRIDLSFL